MLEKSRALVRRPTFIDPSLSSADEEIPRADGTGFDAVLYIKMGLHPMTLEDYIWPDQQIDQQTDQHIAHCYHTKPAASILLAILELVGIPYVNFFFRNSQDF